MEYEEILIVDDELDYEGDDYRNAIRPNRRGTRRPPSRGGRGRPNRRVSVGRPRRPAPRPRRPANAGPVIREDTGGLSTGVLINAGAQILAAIQSLPTPPVATGETSTDLPNLILYQAAISEHAKRDEQLRTIGSLLSKFFA